MLDDLSKKWIMPASIVVIYNENTRAQFYQIIEEKVQKFSSDQYLYSKVRCKYEKGIVHGAFIRRFITIISFHANFPPIRVSFLLEKT